jgi:hypothetical protein
MPTHKMDEYWIWPGLREAPTSVTAGPKASAR